MNSLQGYFNSFFLKADLKKNHGTKENTNECMYTLKINLHG